MGTLVLLLALPPALGQTAVDYVIVPGDKVQITVLGYPDHSSEIIVRPDGKISLPLVGELLVAGKTPAEVSTLLTEALAVYLKQPVVTVSVLEFAPRLKPKVMVLGSVRNPGAYEIVAGDRVLDAMVMAGWIVGRAALDQVGIIRRDANGKFSVKTINLDQAIRKGDLSQNDELRNADVVYVPESNRVTWQDILGWISGLSLIRRFFGIP